jgi:hypothetical protein
VGAAAGLYANDPLCLQGLGPHQKLGILAGVNIVGHHRQRQVIPQRQAELFHQSGFSGSHRAANANPYRLGSLHNFAQHLTT